MIKQKEETDGVPLYVTQKSTLCCRNDEKERRLPTGMFFSVSVFKLLT
jgi:hypothetical protein